MWGFSFFFWNVRLGLLRVVQSVSAFSWNVAGEEKKSFEEQSSRRTFFSLGQDATFFWEPLATAPRAKDSAQGRLFSLPCESPARYANVSFSGSGIKAGREVKTLLSVSNQIGLFWFTAFPFAFIFLKRREAILFFFWREEANAMVGKLPL